MHRVLLCLCFSTHVLFSCTKDVKGFDDTILFDINWPGRPKEEASETIVTNDRDHLIITTAFKEQYKCTLPRLEDKEANSADTYDGPTPLELLAPLFSQTACSYRLESYWTYEVCHNRHIRQYHEDREGKKVKVQEYILGEWGKNQYNLLLDEMKSHDNNTPILYKKIDGNNLPYFEIVMGNGTQCELNQNKPRVTKVLYVCYASGKHEVYSVKETSTCVYEAVILSPLLCAHPKYKAPENGENEINCIPLNDSLNRPRNMMKMAKEQKKLRHKSEIDRIRLEFHTEEKEAPPKIPAIPVDLTPVKSFLAGENCLNGGAGWWKYKFCYGKYIEQYHTEKDGVTTAIILGRFNKEKHLQWLVEHPKKRPKPLAVRKHVSHLYADGSVCDRTGKPRRTEVRLMCMKNAPSISAVSLYLVELRYCEYNLVVESPLICNILSRADEDGMIAQLDDVDGLVEESAAKIEL